MRIEAYFQQLCKTIDSCPVVRSFNVTYDKRGCREGFIRGEVYFVDGSILHRISAAETTRFSGWRKPLFPLS